MATNNLASAVATAVQSAVSNPSAVTGNEQVNNLVNEAANRVGYIQNVAQNYGSYTDEQKAALRSDPLGFLKSDYENYVANKTGTEAGAEGTAGTPEKEYTPREGQDNVYAGQNTVDHSDELQSQYDATLGDYNAAVDKATGDAVGAAESYQKAGLAEYETLKGVNQKDYQDAIATREAIEASNGNRNGIGHSQYGNLEQAYNSRLGELQDAENALRTQTVRAIADARAQGDHAKANAMLATAQAKLKAIYEEQLRIDTNLRSNYEWQTGIDQDDKKIQAELDATELEWQRSLGEALLKAGIVPGMDILDSMGMSQATAKKIAKYARYASSSGGSGGSSSSDSGDGNPGTNPVPAGSTYEHGDYTAISGTAYTKAANGDISGSREYLGKAYAEGHLTNGQYVNMIDTVDAIEDQNTFGQMMIKKYQT